MNYEISPKELERFYSKIKFNEKTWCWDWIGTTLITGYGLFKLKGKGWSSHRLSYLLHRGELIEGLSLNHLCGNKICCNPEHLEQVIRKESIIRGKSNSTINKRKTHCKRGHEFTFENTYVSPKGKRLCRNCERIHHKANYHKNLKKSREKSRTNHQKWVNKNRDEYNAKRRKKK